MDKEKLKDKILSCISIDEKTLCWNWTGYSKSSNGKFFPTLTFNGKKYSAIRTSFEIFIGEVFEDNLLIYRNCKNTKCVCPDHLEIRTRKSFAIERPRKSFCKHGHSMEDCYEIKTMGRIYRQCKKCQQIRRKKK